MARFQTQQRRAGTVVIAVAVSLIGILGVIALTLDGGLMVDKRRQVQSATDAAALAAAGELFKSAFTNDGYDNGPVGNRIGPAAGTIAEFARNVAKQNGFEDGVDGVSVDVFIPPQTGPFAGMRGHVEVVISTAQKRHFSTLFGSSNDIPVGARAVARGVTTTIKNGIIVLDPDDKGAFSTGGGGSATIGGAAAVLVNSSHAEAMIANGGGTVTSQSGYEVTGGWTTPGGGSFSGPITTGVSPTPDPLRFLPPPDKSTLTVQRTQKLQHSSATTITLNPGIYIGGISISGQGSVFLNPGIYYMDGGGFSVTAQGSLTGYKVMIYNDPKSNSDVINLAGGGAITLTPPDEGTYKGITLYQRRDGLPQPDVSVTGTGQAPMSIAGTFYAPSALLKITGNGTEDTIGSQYISGRLTIFGNGSFDVDWDPDTVPGVRQVWLVE